MQPVAESSVDQDRQDQLSEITAEHGPGWEAQYRPGSFGCHELLDRINLAGDFVEKNVLNHPSCALNGEWHQLAAQAVETLRELYQRVGAVHLDETGPGELIETGDTASIRQ